MSDATDHLPAAGTFRRPGRGHGRLLLGVCAGLARRWDLEPRTVRAAFAVTLVPFGAGLLVYGALAAVMPADGASDRSAGRRGELGRSLAQAIVVLLGLFAVALVGALSTGLAVFGLSPIALLLATAALAAVVVVRDGRLWMLGVVVLALAVPAAVAELSDTTIARQVGRDIVPVTAPGDVRADGYRAGTGPLLLDLRGFDADDATTTTIRARADLRPLVVALPTDRCFNLVVDYRLHRTWVARALGRHGTGGLLLQSDLGYRPVAMPSSTSGDRIPVPALVAYGKAIPGLSGRYLRPVADASAPTIHLELTSGRMQMLVRDFPTDLDPLGSLRSWTAAAHQPATLADLARGVRTLEPRRAAPRLDALTNRQLRAVQQTAAILDHRRAWPALEARRLAGACASPVETSRISARLTAAVRRESKADERAVAGSAILRFAIDIEREQQRRNRLRAVKLERAAVEARLKARPGTTQSAQVVGNRVATR